MFVQSTSQAQLDDEPGGKLSWKRSIGHCSGPTGQHSEKT